MGTAGQVRRNRAGLLRFGAVLLGAVLPGAVLPGAVLPGTLLIGAMSVGCSGEAPEDEGPPRGAASGRGRESRPNVLLVSIDSLRSDHLGSSGRPVATSPVLDRLAREGASFPYTISTTSWTLPAHVSMLTSLVVAVHGVGLGRSLDPARTTLAEAMRDDGFETAAFVTGPWMTPAFGLDRGFERFANTSAFSDGSDRSGDGTRPSASAHARSHQEVTGETIADSAIAWLDETPEPFFLFLHFWDVHFDYIPPEPFDELFDPGYRGSVDGVDFATDPDVHAGMAPRDLEHVKALYDGEIRFTDRNLGRVLDHLRESGRLDDTLVVVTADHGDEFFEHGQKGHNKSLYDEVVVVPLILRWPGKVPAGRLVDDPVRLIDVAPTVLDLAGLPAGAMPEGMGRSVAAWWSGDRPAPAPAFMDLFLLPGFQFQGLRTEDSKTMVKYDGDAARAAVFDLEADPRERVPHAPTGRWEAPLREFERTRDLMDSLRRALPGGEGAPVELDARTEAQLRALGYLK